MTSWSAPLVGFQSRWLTGSGGGCSRRVVRTRSGEPATLDTADLDRLRPFYTELGIQAPGAITTPDYVGQLAAILESAPPVVSFVMGIPDADFLAAAREREIRTIGTATTVDEAIAVAAAGMDAVVASGSDVGGHRGAFLHPVHESLVGTFALIPQVAEAVSIPVVAAGGIADTRGSRPPWCSERTRCRSVQASWPPRNLARVRSTVPRCGHTRPARPCSPGSSPGRPARGIANRFTRDMAEFEAEVPAYPAQNTLMTPIRATATERGDANLLNLWSGHAVALADSADVADYLAELVDGLRRS